MHTTRTAARGFETEMRTPMNNPIPGMTDISLLRTIELMTRTKRHMRNSRTYAIVEGVSKLDGSCNVYRCEQCGLVMICGEPGNTYSMWKRKELALFLLKYTSKPPAVHTQPATEE